MEELNPAPEDWEQLRKGMMSWWEDRDFNFPWRTPGRDEWELLVTEILLQRTRANAVAEIYDDFFERFSSPAELGDATVEDVEEAIYSLGLRWRAKFLTRLGARLDELGSVPESRDDIEKLPGVGPYVAGAFLALHRNQHAPFVDANVVRLLGNYFGFEWDGETRRKRWFLELVNELFDHQYQPSQFGYALLDFTREVCARAPDHEACPGRVRNRCAGHPN